MNNDFNKILHVAFVEYFLLMQKVEVNGAGWTEEYKGDALKIFDDCMIAYANLISGKVEK